MPENATLNIVQKIVLALIRWYQCTLSLDHSPRKMAYPMGYCRFTPTCSEYGYEAIYKHGIIKGSVYTLWRILRCNPLSTGGYDPVP